MLDAGGFNEVRRCRSGPMLYNKFDVYIGGSLQKYGEFSWGEQALFRRIVRPGQLVVEVGANIGAHTVDLAKATGPRGRVFAFEPQRLVFQALCANLALNQCVNVFAHQVALGATEGSLLVPALDPSARNNFGGLWLQGKKEGKTVQHGQGESVPLRNLDSFALPACDFLKADVEGMEVEVLRGAQETIRKCRPVMYLENDRADRSAELIDLAMGLGYDLYWHTPPLFNPENFAREKENIFPGIVSINLLCVPSESEWIVNGFRRVTSPQDSWKG
ncbi:MAG: FkbM family methyltransferase [Phycisphaerales bacterium]|nr:FkbM family methyltransferase [Phycisphaerales bacterium]